MFSDPSLTNSSDPLADSLFGEYARMLLIGTAGCSAIASAVRIGVDSGSLMLVLGNVLALASLVSSRFPSAVRLTVLVCFAVLLSWTTIQQDTPDRWSSPMVFFSPAVLLASLVILAVRECVAIVRVQSLRVSFRSGAVMIGIAGVLVYMIVLPSIDAFLEQYRDRPSSYTIEELTALEQLRIRSAKFAVFAIFTYFGACVASFINVVAASAPRGESIALRSSACPKCETPIRRTDNLPIFSYLNLGGRCRACAADIPIRYFWVELIGAAIFGLLFLYELVTGAANVPGAPHYHYAGILWIILYTKWPVIGLYLYHVAMFSCLLMLALMDVDRLRCPKWLARSMVIVLATLPIAFTGLQPVAFDAQIPIALSQAMPTWLVQAVTSVLGGITGWALAILVQRFASKRIQRRKTSLSLAAALVGITLGWQATVTIALFCLIAASLLTLLSRWNGAKIQWSATSMLFTIAMLHQPAWKWLAALW
ncbi:A24 family peptidase [Rubripirellula tenax]|nr:prepilin peptidase [Rubripirellula tenax]